jgi:hypothetical protein
MAGTNTRGIITSLQTLTDGATINWDMSLATAATVTLGGNRTLATPTNIQIGQTYKLVVKQDATGSRTLTFPGIFKWPSGIQLGTLLTPAANAVDIFEIWVESATALHVNFSVWDSR